MKSSTLHSVCRQGNTVKSIKKGQPHFLSKWENTWLVFFERKYYHGTCMQKWPWHELQQHSSWAQILPKLCLFYQEKFPSVATLTRRKKQRNLQRSKQSGKTKVIHEYSTFEVQVYSQAQCSSGHTHNSLFIQETLSNATEFQTIPCTTTYS